MQLEKVHYQKAKSQEKVNEEKIAFQRNSCFAGIYEYLLLLIHEELIIKGRSFYAKSCRR